MSSTHVSTSKRAGAVGQWTWWERVQAHLSRSGSPNSTEGQPGMVTHAVPNWTASSKLSEPIIWRLMVVGVSSGLTARSPLDPFHLPSLLPSHCPLVLRMGLPPRLD